MALMTLAEYARHRNVSRAAVTYAVRDGRISTTKDPKTGKRVINPEVADREWDENSDAEMMRHHTPQAETGTTFNKAKTNTVIAKAELLRLELQERQGLLVKKSEVQAEASKIGRTFREALLNLPDRLAAAMAAEFNLTIDKHKVHMVMEKECRRILEDIVNGLI